MKVIVIICALSFLTGCATRISESGLYWGNYSSTLYEYKKNPSKETLLAHQNELIQILSKSRELNLRAPPGLQAELGSIYAEVGKKDLAQENFLAERSTYPESELLVGRLLAILNGKNGGVK